MIKVANAPCSWGILEFELERGVTDCLQILEEMREVGYEGTELGDWGFLPTDPAELAQAVSDHQLDLLAAFVPVALSDPAAGNEGIEAAIRTARLLAGAAGGNAFIVLADDNGKDGVRTKYAGRISSDMGLSSGQWQNFAAAAENIARSVLETTGLRTVFHHHCAGFVETPEEVEKLLRLTDSGLLGLCLDTGHYRFGGGDPVEAIERFAGRIWHVHFKDCHAEIAAQSRLEGWDYFESVRRGVFCELGLGQVDFESVKRALENIGYAGWIVVEQDVLPGMGTPKESARRNREFLRGIGL